MPPAFPGPAAPILLDYESATDARPLRQAVGNFLAQRPGRDPADFGVRFLIEHRDWTVDYLTAGTATRGWRRARISPGPEAAAGLGPRAGLEARRHKRCTGVMTTFAFAVRQGRIDLTPVVAMVLASVGDAPQLNASTDCVRRRSGRNVLRWPDETVGRARTLIMGSPTRVGRQPARVVDDFEAGHLPLAILPVLVFVVAELLIGILAQRPAMKLPYAAPVLTWPEAAGRINLLACMLLFFAVAAGILCKVLRDIIALVERPALRRLGLVLLIFLATGAAVVGATYGTGSALPKTRDLLGVSVIDVALTEAEKFGAGSSWRAGTYGWILDLTNVLAILAISALVVAGLSCLARISDDAAANWRRQAERLREIVYLSAILMVTGVVFARALIQYPSFVVGKDDAAAYASLVNALVTYTGVEYSLLLASFALPVSYILVRRAEGIARDDLIARGMTVDAAKVDARRAEVDLTFGAPEILKTTAALLAPFLTGTVASLTSFPPA